MKKIQSQNHKKLEADLINHPPLATEDDNSFAPKKKKKKCHKFLNQKFDNLDGVSIEDVIE